MSCSELAIKIENLSKQYQIYEKPIDRLKQSVLPRLLAASGREGRRYYKEFWALKNVNLEVRKGETIGVIGRNGSGKSTLLQLICGTLNPSHGTVNVNGRIAALLELGAGFNPEFTGKENVYMNGAVLGLSEEEVRQRFGEIASFADIGAFIEQPVKMYSSGMYVRLAFATAIAVEPDVLIVDEALSVGDEAFARKCFGRIAALKSNGTTVLFVSHAGGTVIELCDRAVLLDAGEMLMEGSPKTVVTSYQKLIYAPAEAAERLRHDYLQQFLYRKPREEIEHFPTLLPDKEKVGRIDVLGNGRSDAFEAYDPHLLPPQSMAYAPQGADILNPKIETSDGRQVNLLVHGRSYWFTYSVKFSKAALRVQLGMLIKTVSGFELAGAALPAPTQYIDFVPAEAEIKVRFKFTCLLNPAVYFLNAGVTGESEDKHTYLDRKIDILMFRVNANQRSVATSIVDLEFSGDLAMTQ